MRLILQPYGWLARVVGTFTRGARRLGVPVPKTGVMGDLDPVGGTCHTPQGQKTVLGGPEGANLGGLGRGAGVGGGAETADTVTAQYGWAAGLAQLIWNWAEQAGFKGAMRGRGVWWVYGLVFGAVAAAGIVYGWVAGRRARAAVQALHDRHKRRKGKAWERERTKQPPNRTPSWGPRGPNRTPNRRRGLRRGNW